MNRLDQGHLHPKLEAQRLICPIKDSNPGLRSGRRAVYRKEPFEQLMMLHSVFRTFVQKEKYSIDLAKSGSRRKITKRKKKSVKFINEDLLPPHPHTVLAVIYFMEPTIGFCSDGFVGFFSVSAS
jgi:hypothetical protein